MTHTDDHADRLSLRSEAELQLEREKIAIERERLILERERLEAEREKWRSDAIWKQRAEGRFALPAHTLMLGALLCSLLGVAIGAWALRRGHGSDALDRSDMARRIAQAMQDSTNIVEQAQGRFLLRALSDGPTPRRGGYLVILE